MSLLDLPTAYEIQDSQKTIDTSKLTSADRKELFEHLKENHPQKLEEIRLINEDPVFIELKALFGASISLDRSYCPKSLQKKYI